MVFINAVTPFMLKTAGNPGGLPRTVFDFFRSGVTGTVPVSIKNLVPHTSGTIAGIGAQRMDSRRNSGT